MCNPSSIVAGTDLAKLILTDLVERLVVRDGIVFDRNLCRHAAHSMNPAPVTGLDQQLNIGVEKSLVHGDERPVRQHESRIVPEFLDEAEDVVPTTAIE